MRRSTFVFVAAMAPLACAAEQPAPPPRTASPVASRPVAAAPPAHVSRCSARPSTVYGDEPVVFELEGAGPAGALVAVTALDQRQQVVFRGSAPVPGSVSIADLSSGDFSLRIAGSDVSCQVTVNRELSRHRAAEQK